MVETDILGVHVLLLQLHLCLNNTCGLTSLKS